MAGKKERSKGNRIAVRYATAHNEPSPSDAASSAISGPSQRNMSFSTTKAVERPSTPEKNLPLVGQPVTPERNIAESLISPKLRRALPSKEVFQEITKPLPRTESVDEEALVEQRAHQLVDAYKRVKGEQKQLEADLDNVTSQIAMIAAKWNEGVLDLSAGDYKEEKRRMLGKQQQLMTSVSVLRTMGAQLAGRWTDDMVLGEREVLDDWAHIDDTISRYTNVPGATKSVKVKRDNQTQKKFRSDLIRVYKSSSPTKTANKLWCPIQQDYAPYESTKAAHIVNVNIGEKTAQALFGADSEHIWNVKNGLIIHKDYERLLDTAKAVILPASNDPDETEFKFYLLTDAIGRSSADIWGDMLNGRQLIFKNEFRPSKKYLYFKFVISLLRRRRTEVPGFENDLANLPSPSKVMWASPGPYMKKSILYKFSRQLGCISAEEANRFWDVPEAPAALPAEDEDLATSLSLASSSSMSAEIAESEVRGEAVFDPFAEIDWNDESVDGEGEDDEDEDDEDEDDEDEDDEDEDDEDEDDEDEESQDEE